VFGGVGGIVADSISPRPRVDDMPCGKNLYNPAASTKRRAEVQIECRLEGRQCEDEGRRARDEPHRWFCHDFAKIDLWGEIVEFCLGRIAM
jgi:hypothetical protein